ncbi:MAG: tetratricopeptide repeat protein [Lachnospiraceae bacterium]|nr:tetratricopeptide repeat protein [Lachnospiraceae bacterium]
MNCYVCNTIVDNEETCPYCGADIKAYRLIEKACAESYNDGLQRAKMRDLSGAIESLNRSLQYDKYNIDARNLLGLVYYEFGEPVQAMREWVISKNLKPKNNRCDYYLGEIQHGAGALGKLDQTVKKYNQAIEYCKQGNRDLARIQLKKVLGLNSKMVRARQLLALLYMQDGEYENARKELSAAAKTDVKNPRTILYMQEVRKVLKEQNSNNKKKKRVSDLPEYNPTTDAMALPRQTLIETIDNVRGGIFNILIGLGIGLLVTIFLIVPNVRQNANSSAASALVDANEEAAGNASDIVALKAQIEKLEAKLENYEGKGDLQTSYEQLFVAKELYDNGDIDNAAVAIAKVNRDLLGSSGQGTYDLLSGAINTQVLETAYAAAKSAAAQKEYDEAITQYLKVIGIEEGYDNGQALYNLAVCYSEKWDFESALAYYAKVVELYPDTSIARKAQSKMDELNESLGNKSTDTDEEESSSSNTSTTTEDEDSSNTSTTAEDDNSSNTSTTAGDENSSNTSTETEDENSSDTSTTTEE